MLTAVDALRFAGERVGNLSGGEQQRVLIAHALISAPRLLLLDEPLANLDIRSEREVIALLARIAKQQQIAVLISAHEMNPLLPVMDRIVYMAGGRAASGTTAQVVQPDVLSKLYGQHVDVIHIHDRILVVAGQGNGPDPAPEHEPGAAEPSTAEPSTAEPSTAGDRAAEPSAAEHGAAEPSAAEHGSGGEHSAHIEHSRFADRT
jgi:ABC-type multidrug transport system ATPase subunit